ncbi:MAG: hypothetical protein IKS32_05965 [Solobacterium sp.]|nr:hypothetical protein [Solobacterium sp.]
MKFRRNGLAAVLLAFSLTACGNSSASNAAPAPSAEATAEATAAASAEPAAEEQISDEEARKLIDVYQTVMLETYGAEADWSKASREDEIESLYEVKNFKTIDEVITYLQQYMDDSLIDRKQIGYDFKEEDGKLYAVRGGRGYGEYDMKTDSWEFAGVNGVQVPFIMFNEVQKDQYVMLGFEKRADGWKIVHAEVPGLSAAG